MKKLFAKPDLNEAKKSLLDYFFQDCLPEEDEDGFLIQQLGHLAQTLEEVTHEK